MTSPTDAELEQLFNELPPEMDGVFLYRAGYRAAEAANQWREIDPEALPECPCEVIDMGEPFITREINSTAGRMARDKHGQFKFVSKWRPLPDGPK